MSLFTLTRRAAMAVRPATFSFVRLNSTKAVSNASINATKLLTSISADGKTVNADEDAKKWIEAIHELRNEFTRGGTVSFNPSKAFSPDGESEINLLLASHQVNQKNNKFVATPEQIAEAEALKGIPTPVKTDPTIAFLTNVIMRHGRKTRAQRNMSQALYLVYLQTRKDPVQLLKETLEKMAPVLRLRRYTDGGARAEMIPAPLNRRQRLRTAWNWILEGSKKRPSKTFSVRLAEEIVSASNGSGAGYDKKTQVHTAGIAARSFIQRL